MKEIHSGKEMNLNSGKEDRLSLRDIEPGIPMLYGKLNPVDF